MFSKINLKDYTRFELFCVKALWCFYRLWNKIYIICSNCIQKDIEKNIRWKYNSTISSCGFFKKLLYEEKYYRRSQKWLKSIPQKER